MSEKPIGIVELIDQVKQELRKAQATDPMFVLEKVTLEISYTVERSGNAGIDLKVVQFGTELANTHVQTITLDLGPLVPIDQTRDEALAGMPADKKNVLEKSTLRSD